MGLPCEWCYSNRSCVDISLDSNCSTIDSCAVEVCREADDCDMCLRTPGCGWCSETVGCVDMLDAGNCKLSRTCSEVLRDFSVGSFFGGMAVMLVVWLVIGLASYFYKRRNPPTTYEQVSSG